MRLGLNNKRSKLGWTHDDAAEKSGISRPFYTNIENGVKDPSMKVMKRIADAMGATVDELFFDNKVPNRNNQKTTA